jgi:hypothetical protein
MIKNILFILVIIIIWLAFNKEKAPEDPFANFDNPQQQELSLPDFACEGKKNCSEMTSCEEAKFYMRNCSGTNLDPDGDGIPCEGLCTGS